MSYTIVQIAMRLLEDINFNDFSKWSSISATWFPIYNLFQLTPYQSSLLELINQKRKSFVYFKVAKLIKFKNIICTMAKTEIIYPKNVGALVAMNFT